MIRQLLLAGAGAALLLGAPPAPASASEALVDGIAAQVGTRIVLISEVMRNTAPQEAMMREQGAPESEIAKLRAEALDRLIEARLMESVVQRLELYAKDEEIDRTIEAIAKENGITLEQLYASVVFHGMTREQYRQQIKQDLERRNVLQNLLGADIDIDEKELRALYESEFGSMPETNDLVRVRQILVSFGGPEKRSAEQACEVVEAARERIEGGAEFAEVAREVSEVAPNDGGDIGWLQQDQLASWMNDALDPLEPGGVSDTLVLPFGCSILRLEEERNVQRVTFEKARPRLHEELWSRKMEEAYRKWMEELRADTYIERRGYFADAARFGRSSFPVEPDSGLPGS